MAGGGPTGSIVRQLYLAGYGVCGELEFDDGLCILAARTVGVVLSGTKAADLRREDTLARDQPGDFAGNTKKILDDAARGGDLGADLVVFPELAVCGYPPADLLDKAVFVARAEPAVTELAGWTGVAGRPAILCGTVMAAVAKVGKVRNAAALLDGDE